MILYNQKYQLIAMSDGCANIFGYKNIDDFCQKHRDISDFFTHTSIFKTQNIHFIEFMITHQNFNIKSIPLKLDDGSQIFINMSFERIFIRDEFKERYFQNSEFLYEISVKKEGVSPNFNPLTQKSKKLAQIRLPNVEANKNILTQSSNKYKISKEWLINLALKYGDKTAFNKSLLEFLGEAKDAYDKLCDATLLGDRKFVENMVKKLMPKAVDLGFGEFCRTLEQFEISMDNKSVNFTLEKYKNFIEQLEILSKEDLNEQN